MLKDKYRTVNMKEKGFTIVELMVSLLLGVMLLVVIGNLFVSHKRSYGVQEGLARIQENGRYTKYLMTRDLRMSSFQGCNNIANTPPHNLITTPAGNQSLTADNAIRGFEASGAVWSPTLPTWLTSKITAGTNIVPGTDVVIIRRLSAQSVYLSANMPLDSASINVPNQVSFKDGDVLFITDCGNTNVFKATAGTTATSISHSTANNISNRLAKAYQMDAQVGKLLTFAYYIKDTGRTNRSGLPILSLFRQDIEGNEQELVEGMENLQITYGLDTNSDGSVDTYSTANAISTANRWPQVISINIAALLNSVDEINNKPQAYTFLGASTTPADRMLRREWDSYIKVRNRDL